MVPVANELLLADIDGELEIDGIDVCDELIVFLLVVVGALE